jgi:hypothetical protein
MLAEWTFWLGADGSASKLWLRFGDVVQMAILVLTRLTLKHSIPFGS